MVELVEWLNWLNELNGLLLDRAGEPVLIRIRRGDRLAREQFLDCPLVHEMVSPGAAPADDEEVEQDQRRRTDQQRKRPEPTSLRSVGVNERADFWLSQG